MVYFLKLAFRISTTSTYGYNLMAGSCLRMQSYEHIFITHNVFKH